MPFSPTTLTNFSNTPSLGLDGDTPNPGTVTYLKVRAYLYKFAPEIIPVQVQPPSTAKQFNISHFIYDLNPADLLRFDISGFVSGYTTNQEVGLAGSVGKMNGSLSLQDAIVPFNSLAPSASSISAAYWSPVRRPIFFPDADGNYLGWNTADAFVGGVFQVAPTTDPVTKEAVSTIDEDDLVIRLAMLQTMEDNGGDTANTSIINSSFNIDILTIQVAIRLRGIRDPRKKELIINFFKTGDEDDELTKLIPKANQATFRSTIEDPVGNVNNQLYYMSLFTDKNIDGIALSDLIQKRDFISIFIYDQLVPADAVETLARHIDPFFFDKESLFMYTPDSILGVTDGKYFEMYTAEFNGFVESLAFRKNVGEVNSLQVDMIGSMGLFGATQRIYNSTIYQGSIFDAAETYDVGIISLFENMYQGKDPFTILNILLDSVYLLRVSIPQNPTEVKLTKAQASEIAADATKANNALPLQQQLQPSDLARYIAKQQAIALAQEKESIVTQAPYRDLVTNSLSSFGDILSLRAFNQYGLIEASTGTYAGPKHLFNMSSFLYLNVMRLRRFNVRLPNASDVEEIGGHSHDWPFDAKGHPAIPPFAKETDGSGGSILEINPALDTTNNILHLPIPNINPINFKPYFLMLNDSLGSYTPGIRTPFEIMNDISATCFLELFETPGGRFIFRTPQYNNNQSIATQSASTSTAPASMLTSGDVVQISSDYAQTVSGLLTKRQLGYGVDIIGQLLPILYYFYSNGKLVSQYGLQMGSSDMNPNGRDLPKDTTNSYKNGIFQYARFFMEYVNMQLLTGRVEVVGSPDVQAGRTYFDISNQKFGYIRGVSKTLTVGETYRASLDLIAVRDAALGPKVNGNIQPIFRRIPEMEDFVPLFNNPPQKVPASNIASYQTAVGPPSKMAWLSFAEAVINAGTPQAQAIAAQNAAAAANAATIRSGNHNTPQ